MSLRDCILRISFFLAAVSLMGGLRLNIYANVATVDEQVDFLKDVYPIFEQHCLCCHGEKKQEGNLRLDRVSSLATGGHTGQVLLGGGENNAILKRVTTEDVSLRMPKDAPPLTSDEIAVIHKWVEQGTPWEDPPTSDSGQFDSAHRQPRFVFSREDLKRWNPYLWSNRDFEKYMKWRTIILIPFSLLVALMLVCEQCKRRVQFREKTGGEVSRWTRRLARVSPSTFGFVLTMILLVVGAMYYQDQTHQADAQIADLQSKIDELVRMTQGDTQTYLSRPIRPPHPPRLGGIYYRGNDERSEKLFNGGYYRTAEMSVYLQDEDGRRLEWGDDVQNKKLVIQLDIKKSFGSTPALFTENIFQTTRLSNFLPQKAPKAQDVSLQTTTFEKVTDEHYRTRFPIAMNLDAEGNGHVQGVLYLYRQSGGGGMTQYGIEYDLIVRNGRIDQKSELWMGCTFKTPNVVSTPPGKIPEDQWFSFLPIPEIEGENTQDESLLGVDDYREELNRSPKDNSGSD